MAEKIIKINGKEIKFKATAGTPRIYRNIFDSDMMVDMQKLVTNVEENKKEIDIASLELFENIAYAMARHGDPTITDNPIDWLDEFDTMELYETLPKIFELWQLNVKTNVTQNNKKKIMTK
jgi:hypothetical protein